MYNCKVTHVTFSLDSAGHELFSGSTCASLSMDLRYGYIEGLKPRPLRPPHTQPPEVWWIL